MTSSSVFSLSSVYAQLTSFANLSNFWSLFDTAFGSSYDFATAASFRSQWQSGNFSLFPQIEVVSGDVLGTANGAYAISTNRIYLSDRFVSSASQQSLEAVILEEFGHFVDAQVNQADTAGDEGELFSALVRGVNLSAAELSRIKTENDWATLSLNDNLVPVELSSADPNYYPWITGNYDTPGSAWDVKIVGNLAYFEDGNSLQIIDISNPASPTFKGSYILPNYCTYGGVQIVGNLAYLYVAGSYGAGSLQIIDISNPASPTFKGSYGSRSASGLQVVGNLAYLVSANNNSADYSDLQIIDISNPASPIFKGSYTTYSASGVQVVGSLAYTVEGSSGLQIFDISNPASPSFKSSYDTGYAVDVQIVGNLAYVADSSSVQIIDISNPAQPTFKGSYDTLAVDIEIVGSLAYITGDTGDVSTDNTYGISGVQIIDIANPAAPTFKAFYGTPGAALGVEVAGNNVYVASGTDGISIFGAYSPGATLSLAPTNANQTEGNSGSKAFTFTVTRTGNTTTTNTVNWVVTGTGTNPANATDFVGGVLPSGTVTFAANSTSQVISVSVKGDTTFEPNETFTVNLYNPNNGAALSTATAIGTITNDDLPSINLSPNGQTVVEGLTSPQNLSYTVSLSGSSTQTITVQYSTANGTALAGSDYTATTGTLTFNPGVTSQTISIPILNDAINEANETFTLKLTSPTNAILGGTATVTTTITDTLSASTTTTLAANVENLTLTGTTAINGTGNTGNNVITGNNGNNVLNGGAGIDTLTGGIGTDTFVFQFGQSLVANSDRITDFAIGTDKIDLLTQNGLATNAPTAFTRAVDSSAANLTTVVNNVFTDANGAIAGNQALAINSAALVKVTTTGIAGTYLVVNDSTAGFQATNDLLVNITGFTGTIPALGTIAVNNFFV